MLFYMNCARVKKLRGGGELKSVSIRDICIPLLVLVLLPAFSFAQTNKTAELSDEELAAIMLLEDSRNAERETFGPLLRHENTAVRVRACLALGRIGLLEFPDWFREDLEKVLGEDPEAEVRAMAAFALGEANEGDALPVIINAFNDRSGIVREAAAEAASKLGRGEAVPALLRLLDEDESPAVRRTVLLTSWRFADPRTAAVAAELFGSGPAELRWPSAYHLAQFRRQAGRSAEVPVTGDLLSTMASDADPEVRRCAAKLYTALELSDAEVVERFKPLLQDDDRGVIVQSLRAAAGARSAGLAEEIIALMKSGDPHLRLEAVRAAGVIGGDVFKERLRNCLEDEEEAVAAEALRALAVIDSENLPEIVSQYLGDERPQVRAAAAAFLGRVPGQAAGRLWRIAWADEYGPTRQATVQALEDLPEPYSTYFLLGLLEDTDPVIVAMAAGYLRDRPAPGVSGKLAEAYKANRDDPNFEAKAEILRLLAAFKDHSAAVAALGYALEDPDRNARIMAAALLAEIDGNDYSDSIGVEKTGRNLDFYRQALALIRKYPAAVVSTTEGEITLGFAGEDAPLAVHNFITLAQKDYFDGIIIHRVVPDFVVQDGCPRGDGWGGPGYSIRCEINRLGYERGAVGMALAGKDTGGSQWFITLAPQPHLDGGYTIFAHVVGGMEVADRLMQGDKILDVRLLEEEP
jgi:cyclophilin family peptidyl-prolyl cis-trans isomerase/HEAT repeat protein